MRDALYSSCSGLWSAAIHRNATNPKNTIPMKIRFSIIFAFPLTVRSAGCYTAFHNNVQNYAIAELRHKRVYGCRKKRSNTATFF
jgi:hypothetical protein